MLDLSAAEAGGLYRHAFVLSRPDQHVAWRGDHLPADPLALVDRVRGAGGPIAAVETAALTAEEHA